MFDYCMPILIAFAITFLITKLLIPFLIKIKVSNTEREEGVKSHFKKAGTPTMGGFAFLIGISITGFIFSNKDSRIIPIIILMCAFGLIGFLDDFLKVFMRSSDGLIAWQKMLLQLCVTAGFAIYMYKFSGISMSLQIPFVSKVFDIGVFAVPLLFFVVLGTVNAVNFTDGLDGLASTVTLVVAIFFTIAAIIKNINVSPLTCAVIGGLMAFLMFNSYPAKIFMGDTGSLALGGFVVGAAYMLEMPLFIIIIGAIYLAEIISVMIQVVYFKKTNGKRFFKMTPIHHHFELSGWSETKIVAAFSIITAMLCTIALLGIK